MKNSITAKYSPPIAESDFSLRFEGQIGVFKNLRCHFDIGVAGGLSRTPPRLFYHATRERCNDRRILSCLIITCHVTVLFSRPRMDSITEILLRGDSTKMFEAIVLFRDNDIHSFSPDSIPCNRRSSKKTQRLVRPFELSPGQCLGKNYLHCAALFVSI